MLLYLATHPNDSICSLRKYMYVMYSSGLISRISAVPSVNKTLGNSQDVICLLMETSGLDPNSVISTWSGPNGVVSVDDRITINTTVDDNSFITILHFDYLFEGDEGAYTCSVTTSDHSVSISTNLTDLISELIM